MVISEAVLSVRKSTFMWLFSCLERKARTARGSASSRTGEMQPMRIMMSRLAERDAICSCVSWTSARISVTWERNCSPSADSSSLWPLRRNRERFSSFSRFEMATLRLG